MVPQWMSYKPGEGEHKGIEGGDEGRCGELKEGGLGGSQVECWLTLGLCKY